MKNNKEESKQLEMMAELFTDQFQVTNCQNQKETNDDPWDEFAFWVLLPLFFASMTALVIVIIKSLWGL